MFHTARTVLAAAIVKLLTVIVALACSADLAAATKYVAKHGNDLNDGDSVATAYLTITKGLRNIEPGGRLVIGGGTYAEAVINAIPSGLSDGARTTVTNNEHEFVILRPEPGPARVLEFIGKASFITVAANGPGEIILDGTHVSHNVVKFSAAGAGGAGEWPSYIRLQNLEIKHGPNSGVLGYPRRCEFIGLSIHHAGTSVFDHGMYISGTDNVIDGCDIHHNYARGIQIFMSKKHSDPGFASRNVVRNCRIHHNGLTPGRLKPGVDADSGTGNRIHDNLIHGNGQFGLMIQMGGAENEVYNNTFHDNGTAAVMVKSSAGAGNVLRNNRALASNSGPQFINERSDTVVSDNVWDATEERSGQRSTLK